MKNNNFYNSGGKIKTNKNFTAVILTVAVIMVALSFTGCGLLFNNALGNSGVFEDQDHKYTDIQLQDSQGSTSDTVASAPEMSDSSPTLDINEGQYVSSNVTDFTNVVTMTEKSVVEINTETVTYSKWSGQYIVTGAGSGVIISQDSKDKNIYYIVTNDHVIDGAENITVILYDGKKYTATLIGTDAVTDVALVAIEVADGEKLTVATLANPETKLLDGQDIYVIGNPLGELGGSVSKGIISKTARKILISGVKMELMQIDAAVNPGNSGGGLFDIRGNLIGIVNAKYSEEGIEGLGFAIPINTVKSVVLELSQNGYVTGRPGLGFEMIEKTYTTGGYISSVNVIYPTVSENKHLIKGTYIDSEGKTQEFIFSEGDVICEVNGTEVNSLASLQSYLMDYKIGDTVTVGVMRRSDNGRNYVEYSVSLVLSEYVVEE